MKKTIFVLLVILPLIAGNGFATVYTGSVGPELTYTLDSGTGHVVIEGRGAMTSDDLSNYPKREYVKTVSFPEGLTSICANAFHGCYNLQSIVLPDSVTTIGAYAFQECTKMTSADLGKGIKTIDTQAFIFCTALRKVRWSDCLESIGDMAFYNCTSIGDTVFFPKTFKTMGWGAFGSENYNSASKVMVWEAIHANDFVRYESDVPGENHFTHIIFGDSVEYIPNMLCKFMYNDSITLPETVDLSPVLNNWAGWGKRNVERTVCDTGVSRVVDVEEVLKMAKYRGEGTVCIGIYDDIYAPWNNGTFTVTFGKETTVTRGGTPDIEMTINAFSSGILGRIDAENLPMFPGVKICNDTELSGVFYKKPLWIEEHF